MRVLVSVWILRFRAQGAVDQPGRAVWHDSGAVKEAVLVEEEVVPLGEETQRRVERPVQTRNIGVSKTYCHTCRSRH